MVPMVMVTLRPWGVWYGWLRLVGKRFWPVSLSHRNAPFNNLMETVAPRPPRGDRDFAGDDGVMRPGPGVVTMIIVVLDRGLPADRRAATSPRPNQRPRGRPLDHTLLRDQGRSRTTR